MYGEVSEIGIVNALLIIGQLFVAGYMVILLDELMQKGYGMGSGVSLFIATNICENIIWRALSPITMKTENGIEFEGALVNLIHLMVVKPNKLVAFQQAMYRSHVPNMNNLLSTIFIFFIVIYFQGFKIDLKLCHQQVKGATQSYPIKLFYLSSTPIILQTALVSNLHFFSSILYRKFKNNAFVRLLGVWQENDVYGGGPRLIGGFAYYLTPPTSFMDVFYNPRHAFFYFSFIVISCALFSKLWLEMSGRSPSDVVKQITEQGMFIQGKKKESMLKILGKYIPTAAILGGVCIGLLTIMADLLGAIGSGSPSLT
jgi:protein transport protein SEC61 subunit alpha